MREMVHFMSKTNGNFIKSQCISTRTVGGHLLRGVGNIKLYSWSGGGGWGGEGGVEGG